MSDNRVKMGKNLDLIDKVSLNVRFYCLDRDGCGFNIDYEDLSKPEKEGHLNGESILCQICYGPTIIYDHGARKPWE